MNRTERLIVRLALVFGIFMGCIGCGDNNAAHEPCELPPGWVDYSSSNPCPGTLDGMTCLAGCTLDEVKPLPLGCTLTLYDINGGPSRQGVCVASCGECQP